MTQPLSKQIVDVAGSPATVRIGTVTSIFPLSVNLQDTELVGVGVLGSYAIPTVGDVVAVLGQSSVSTDPASWLVLGSIGLPGAQLASEASIRVPTDAQSTSSASFGNILSGGVAASFTFVKQRDNTRIAAYLALSGFTPAAAQAVQTALLINGVDYDIGFFFYNTNNEHHSHSAVRHITGVTAGTYTVTVRYRSLLGGAVHLDTNDLLSVLVRECGKTIL